MTVSVLASCSSSSSGKCTPGASSACTGSGGCSGGQVCNTDGTSFGVCICASTGGDGGLSDAGGSTSASDSGGAAGAEGGTCVDQGGCSVDASCDGGACGAPTVVSAGARTACAIVNGGSIVCWGANATWELGDSGTGGSATPVAVTGISSAISVSVSLDPYNPSACAVLSSGAVECWGSNQDGQLGNGMTTGSATPVMVQGIGSATAVSVGGDFACALLANGTVNCWGYNGGVQQTRNSSTPIVVSGINTATAVTAGAFTACALLSGGTVECWGAHPSASVSSTSPYSAPMVAADVTDAVYISASGDPTGVDYADDLVCAAQYNGAVECWGVSPEEEIGAIAGVASARAVSVGLESECAVLSSGNVTCWGDDTKGEIGIDAMSPVMTPTTVPSVSGAVAVSVGGAFACVSLQGGSVKCWGDNQYGQLGNGSTVGSTMPVEVALP